MALWKFTVPSKILVEKCCLVANPVAGNPTQYLVEQAFAQNNLDWRFMTFEVEPARLGDAMRGLRALGFHGIKIGEPFHQSVMEHVDELTEAAKRCGSVNCVTANEQFVGDNTEGAAFVDIVRQHINPVGRRAMIFGAGRIAQALAMALAEAGIAEIVVASRNTNATRQLVERIKEQTSCSAITIDLTGGHVTIEPDTALVVNATSLGSQDPDAKLPLNVDSLSPKMIVADVAYNTARTWLTQQAATRGCRVIDGISLYVHQTALALKAWTGVAPDTVAMREAAEEFLGI